MCHQGAHHSDDCSCETVSCHTNQHHHTRCCCGEQGRGWRRYMTKEEKRRRLEEYASDLEAELAAVRELLEEKK